MTAPKTAEERLMDQSLEESAFNEAHPELQDGVTPREGAVLRTVKKEGKNQGRKFWSYPNDSEFFQWAD